MSAIENIEFSDAEAFLDYLAPRQKQWFPEPANDKTRNQRENLLKRKGWVFRGQSNSFDEDTGDFFEWELIAKVFRNDIFKPFGFSGGSYKGNESRKNGYDVINRFLYLADNLGIPVTANELNRRFPSHEIEMNYTESSVVFEIAQHHGIPTRLLDWSRSPYAAAYFAATDASLEYRGSGAFITVWAFNAAALEAQREPGDPQYLGDIKIIRGTASLNSFLHAQSGCFTLDNQTYNEFSKMLTPLDERITDLVSICINCATCLVKEANTALDGSKTIAAASLARGITSSDINANSRQRNQVSYSRSNYL